VIALTPGLVSITFRRLSPTEVIDLVRQAGLAAIEWGGDIHVPHGDEPRAREVGAATRAAGLTVAAYGSYYRAGHSEQDGPPFSDVLRTALALGAPVIRVWAGTRSSTEADPSYQDWVAREIHRISTLAGDAGLRIALEFHADTLNDTTASSLALLQAADHPALRSLWQPSHGLKPLDRLASLRALGPRLEHLHVFHRDSENRRLPLAQGASEWAIYLAAAARLRPQAAALIEFVAGDRPEQFLEDAAVLRQLLQS
jgi:sugar phosphate isomerase/epimerase